MSGPGKGGGGQNGVSASKFTTVALLPATAASEPPVEAKHAHAQLSRSYAQGPKAQNPYHADDGLDIPMEGPLLPTSVRLGGGGKAAVIERIERRVGAPRPTGARPRPTGRSTSHRATTPSAALEAEDEDGVGYLAKAIAAAQADAVTEVQECGFRPGAAERVNPQPDVLVSIRLQHNPLENYGLGVLAGAISSCAPLTLQSLCLRSVMAGDDGMAVLAVALSNFEGGTGVSLLNLELTDNRLSPASGSHLAAVVAAQERLQDLQLAQNALGDEGASALSAGLLRNQSLTKLSLGSNGIGAEGARALAGGLALHRSLSTLALHHNALRGADDEAVRSLAVACSPSGASASAATRSAPARRARSSPKPTRSPGGRRRRQRARRAAWHALRRHAVGAVRLTHLLLEGSAHHRRRAAARALLSSPLCAVELLARQQQPSRRPRPRDRRRPPRRQRHAPPRVARAQPHHRRRRVGAPRGGAAAQRSRADCPRGQRPLRPRLRRARAALRPAAAACECARPDRRTLVA